MLTQAALIIYRFTARLMHLILVFLNLTIITADR